MRPVRSLFLRANEDRGAASGAPGQETNMQDFWSNLSFSLNATMPVFLTMCVGYFLRAVNLVDDAFADKLNNFVFRIALPVLLFQDLAEADFFSVWDTRYVLFCFAATFLSIGLVSLLGRALVRDVPARGEFIQASYRSSAALLGAAYIENMYHTTGMAPLMIIGAVPLYNIAAVTVLAVTAGRSEGGKADRAGIRKTAKKVLTNPIIDGILVGLVWSLLRIPLPAVPAKVVSNIAQTASPLGLVAMGASIDVKKIRGVLGPSLAAVFFKLLGLCALFLPVAVGMGFRTQKLTAILVMLGSPSTVTCFVMAKNMGHEGSLSSNAVMLSTIASSFTLTLWIWIMRSLGYI